METSPPSSSDLPATAFDRLHPEIRRWILPEEGGRSFGRYRRRRSRQSLAHQYDVVIPPRPPPGKPKQHSCRS